MLESFKKRGQMCFFPRCHRLKLQTQVPRRHMSLLSSQFVLLNATIKKTDQWGNQLAGSAPSGHFLELQGYRRATVPKSHVRPPTFSTKPSRSSNFTPRSLFSSSAGCEILNEPVRTGATRVRLADSAGAPAVTCRGVPAGSREG